MLILGIDPGSRHTGYAVLESSGGTLSLQVDGRVSLSPKLDLPERLAMLAAEVESILDRWKPEAAAVETPFHGMNARSLIVLAQARGAILASLGRRDIETREYSPAEIKAAVAGNGRADKAQVSRMVHLLLAVPETGRSADQTDAMAVAVCFARRYRMDRLRTLHAQG